MHTSNQDRNWNEYEVVPGGWINEIPMKRRMEVGES